MILSDLSGRNENSPILEILISRQFCKSVAWIIVMSIIPLKDQWIYTFGSLLHTSYRLQATCSIKKSCRRKQRDNLNLTCQKFAFNWFKIVSFVFQFLVCGRSSKLNSTTWTKNTLMKKINLTSTAIFPALTVPWSVFPHQ